MTVDNTIYDRIADTWWDDSRPLAILRTGINPVRFAYFGDVLRENLGPNPDGSTLLDVGCGGGFLAEELAGMGYHVTGIDPSERSIAVAAEHARASGLAIDYRTGSGEQLPFADDSFDAVSCCDVLEHVADPDWVIAEIARVLRPGGIFLYDTVNRTARSQLALITVAQDFPLTRIVPPGFHVWRRFIRPDEFHATLRRHGLQNSETAGISPPRNPLALLTALIALKRGKITFAEMGRRLQLHRTRDLSVSYMGYAVAHMTRD